MSEEAGSAPSVEPAPEKVSPDRAAAVLRKLLATGRLQRMPRHPDHQNVLLALLCLDLRRRYPYSEVEMNAYLTEALTGLRARVDHVTCRRYMVDRDFLRRDRAGARYFVNYPKVESVLAEETRSRGRELLVAAMAENRRRRRGSET